MCICLVIPSTDLAQIRSAWLTLHIVKVLDSGATAAVVHMLAVGQPGPFLWAGLLHTKGVQDARSTTAPFCQGLCGQSSSSSSLWERWRHAEGEHNKCRLQLLYIGENTMIHAAEFKQLKPVPEGKPAACRGSAQGVQSTTASRHQRPVYIQQSASAGMATHFNMHSRDPCLTERPDIHAFMTCSDLQNQQDMVISQLNSGACLWESPSTPTPFSRLMLLHTSLLKLWLALQDTATTEPVKLHGAEGGSAAGLCTHAGGRDQAWQSPLNHHQCSHC